MLYTGIEVFGISCKVYQHTNTDLLVGIGIQDPAYTPFLTAGPILWTAYKAFNELVHIKLAIRS